MMRDPFDPPAHDASAERGQALLERVQEHEWACPECEVAMRETADGGLVCPARCWAYTASDIADMAADEDERAFDDAMDLRGDLERDG